MTQIKITTTTTTMMIQTAVSSWFSDNGGSCCWAGGIFRRVNINNSSGKGNHFTATIQRQTVAQQLCRQLPGGKRPPCCNRQCTGWRHLVVLRTMTMPRGKAAAAIIKRKNYRKAFCFSSEVFVNKVRRWVFLLWRAELCWQKVHSISNFELNGNWTEASFVFAVDALFVKRKWMCLCKFDIYPFVGLWALWDFLTIRFCKLSHVHFQQVEIEASLKRWTYFPCISIKQSFH